MLEVVRYANWINLGITPKELREQDKGDIEKIEWYLSQPRPKR